MPNSSLCLCTLLVVPWLLVCRAQGAGSRASPGRPSSVRAVAVQMGNATLLPIHAAPPRAQIPDGFNTSAPGFCMEQGPPHLLCQRPALSAALHRGCFQNTPHHKAVPALQHCFPSTLQPPAANHPAISLQPWLNQQLRWHSAAALGWCHWTEINDHRQGKESAPAALCGFTAAAAGEAGEGWNSVLPSTFNNTHWRLFNPSSRINSTAKPFLEVMPRYVCFLFFYIPFI